MGFISNKNMTDEAKYLMKHVPQNCIDGKVIVGRRLALGYTMDRLQDL